jgi:Ca2+/Na+ antiporter
MKKILLALVMAFVPAGYANAVCPVCTLAVGAGVGLAEYLGIDDVLIGLWIGALTVSMSEWIISYLEKKNWIFKGYKTVTHTIMFASVLLPLYFQGLMWNPIAINQLWGVDKLFLGILIGAIVFTAGVLEYRRYKRVHGHALFPFQKVVWPVAPVVITTLIFWQIIL